MPVRSNHSRALLAIVIAMVAVSSPAAAQVIRGEIGVGGGVSTDQRGVKSSSVTIAPAVLFAPDPHFSSTIGLTGTRFGSQSQAVGGSASVGVRAPMGSHAAL